VVQALTVLQVVQVVVVGLLAELVVLALLDKAIQEALDLLQMVLVEAVAQVPLA
jgi:hypothetical protein